MNVTTGAALDESSVAVINNEASVDPLLFIVKVDKLASDPLVISFFPIWHVTYIMVGYSKEPTSG